MILAFSGHLPHLPNPRCPGRSSPILNTDENSTDSPQTRPPIEFERLPPPIINPLISHRS